MKLPGFSPKPRKPKLFLVRRVTGSSMTPALAPGSLVFGVRPRAIAPGDVVVVRHKELEKVKRIKEIRKNEIFLTGDSLLHSTDSREFGWLPIETIIAKIVWPRKPYKRKD